MANVIHEMNGGLFMKDDGTFSSEEEGEVLVLGGDRAMSGREGMEFLKALEKKEKAKEKKEKAKEKANEKGKLKKKGKAKGKKEEGVHVGSCRTM